MGLEDIKTANVNNSFKKFSSKRKERNEAGAGWGSGIQSEFFGFWVFFNGRNKNISQKAGKWIIQESRELL